LASVYDLARVISPSTIHISPTTHQSISIRILIAGDFRLAKYPGFANISSLFKYRQRRISSGLSIHSDMNIGRHRDQSIALAI
jgi:hypothetical protein